MALGPPAVPPFVARYNDRQYNTAFTAAGRHCGHQRAPSGPYLADTFGRWPAGSGATGKPTSHRPALWRRHGHYDVTGAHMERWSETLAREDPPDGKRDGLFVVGHMPCI